VKTFVPNVFIMLIAGIYMLRKHEPTLDLKKYDKP